MNDESLSVAGFSTLLIHAGEPSDPLTGAIAPNLVRSKTFAQNFGEEGRFQYARGASPTRLKLEEKLVALEGGGGAAVFGSGVAAEAALLLTLSPGDHILFCQEIYGGTYRLMEKLFNRFGIVADYADFSTPESIRAAITPRTKYLWVETPTNPSLHLIDLAMVGQVSRESGMPFIVDSTFAPPCTTRPFDYGAIAVVHSLSKYIAGHNDVLGGAVITTDAALHEQLVFMQKTVGAVLSPDECYRVLQEVKTLELRWERVSKTALEVAEFLLSHGKVARVLYPGLESHPGHAIANRQMRKGFGGVLSFELVATRPDRLKRFVDVARENGPIVYAESLASPETILAYPPHMSHKSLPDEMRKSLGIGDSFFRLSVGFEDPADILKGLAAGLASI